MRYLAVFVLLLGIPGLAVGQNLGHWAPANEATAKDNAHSMQQAGNNPRQGGDTVDGAAPIPGVPFVESGTAAGYTDDYDEVCPYTGSTSPDVVYVYTPSSDITIDVDLCGSAYDTKVYVYDEGLNLIACNDDFYFDDVCGVYVSRLEYVSLIGGSTYYIVIDGYGGDFGDYELEITEFVPSMALPEYGGLSEVQK